MFSNFLASIILFLLAQLFLSPAAHAYLDPGTGAFIVQTLFGLGLACAVTLARFKQRLLAFFGKNKKTGEQTQLESGEQTQAESSDT